MLLGQKKVTTYNKRSLYTLSIKASFVNSIGLFTYILLVFDS